MQILKTLVLVALLIVGASATNDVRIFLLDKSKEMTPEQVEKKFESAGFKIENNRDMNGPYKIQFKQTGFDIYNLFSFYDKEAVDKLLKKYPDVGLFTPISSGIYRREGDKNLYISFPTAKTIMGVLNIEDEPIFNEIEAKIEKVVKSFKDSKEIIPSYKSKSSDDELVTKFTLESSSDNWGRYKRRV